MMLVNCILVLERWFNISRKSVVLILVDNLGLRLFHIGPILIKVLDRGNSIFIKRIINDDDDGDDTWIYQFNKQRIEQLSQWKNDPAPKKNQGYDHFICF